MFDVQIADEFLLVRKTAAATAQDAVRILQQFFQDRVITVDAACEDFWHCRVAWSGACPDAEAADVCRRLFGVPLVDSVRVVNHATLASGVHCTTMLHHSWSLQAWSSWGAGTTVEAPVIVHVDAHDDLGQPCLSEEEPAGTFRTPLGERVRLDQPAEIATAISRGHIGIGSFIRPLLRAVPATEYIWVRPGEPLPKLPKRSRPVWLDIDMDWFDNAYDTNRPGRPVAEDDVRDRIDAFCGQLPEHDWLGALTGITVALSPGFFPARHWEAAHAQLLAHLEQITLGRR